MECRCLEPLQGKAVRQGIKRAHVEARKQQKIRRPLKRELLAAMEACIQGWGIGENIVPAGVEGIGAFRGGRM